MPQTIFCANGSAGDKVEIPVAAVQKSLPKRRESAEKVEIPVAAVRKSLPKRRKSAEKVEIPVDGYLEFIRSITKKYGTLLICDEVMSGFRSSEKSSQGLYGIDPDITCLGKVIGGGLPVAAYGGKRQIMEQVAPVGPMYQAGTLSGNPLAMAAGIANLTYMHGHNVCSQLESMTAILTGGLAKAAAKAGVPVQVHRLGSMFTVFFTDQEVYDYDSACTSDLDAFRIYFHSMLEQGIYLPPSQFETNFLSLAHTPEDIEKTLQAAEIAFSTVAAAKK